MLSLYKKQKPLYKDPFVIIIIVLSFLLLCRILFAVNYRGVYIEGDSMNPTLNNGDYLYISLYDEPDYGDIVTIKKTDGVTIIKRVIALSGDSVYLNEGTVYVMYSGTDYYAALEEEYVSAANNNPDYKLNTTDVTTVPEGYVYVLGDNRTNSNDSRIYGCFRLSSVTGVVTGWSLKYKNFLTALH